MKKIFSVSLLIAVLAFSNLVFASNKGENPFGEDLNTDEMLLGNLKMFTDGNIVKQRYGSPNWGRIGGNNQCGYGDSVILHFSDNKLVKIVVSQNNGWTTPKGIAVGMSIEVVTKMYGEPCLRESAENFSNIAYIYRSATRDGSPSLVFVFDKKNRLIQRIIITSELDEVAARNITEFLKN